MLHCCTILERHRASTGSPGPIPDSLLAALVPTQPPDRSVLVVQEPCDSQPAAALGPEAASATSCLSGAPWDTFIPVWEENQNLLNCVCSQCLVKDCRSGPWDQHWGWVKAVLQGCMHYTGILQKLWCGVVREGCLGTLCALTPGAGAWHEPLLAPVYLSSFNSALGVFGLFPNKFICHMNYNLLICHCMPPHVWMLREEGVSCPPSICPPQPVGTAS